MRTIRTYESHLSESKRTPIALGKDLLALLYRRRRIPDSGRDECRELVSQGADLGVKHPTNGHNALHRAIEFGHQETAIDLIKAGADMNEPTKKGGWAPLHFAIINGAWDVALFLISAGAEVNVRDNAQGWTPLHWAIERDDRSFYKRAEVALGLIDAGADVNMEDFYKVTPLHMAARKGNVELAKRLVEEGANLEAVKGNIYPEFRLTPLGDAVMHGQRETARYLIGVGAVLHPAFRSLEHLGDFFGDTSWIPEQQTRKLRRMAGMSGMFEQ